MLYQYVREPLTADESDRLSNACETTTERLVVWSPRIPRVNGP
jgi:integrase/recombinase XerD